MPTETRPGPSPFQATPGGLRVAVRVMPKASRAGVAGVGIDTAGRAFLRVRVTEPPEGGKANAALIKLLAKAWKLPKSAIAVMAGQSGRRKTLLIAGDAAPLEAHLVAWLRSRTGGTA